MYAALRPLARLPVTLGYGTLLAAATVAMTHLAPDVQDRIVRHTSTNLHNLAQGRLGTLITSAFVVDADFLLIWLPCLMCLLGAAELAWGSLRAATAFAVGHVGSTAVVAVGLTAGVRFGWLPHSVSRADDVGMSYGAAAVLGALTPVVTRRLRPAWAVGWVVVGAVAVWTTRDFTDVGHLIALILGIAVATRFGEPHPWTLPRLILVGPAALFAYLVVSDEAVTTAAPLALMAAAIAFAIAETVRRLRRRALPVAA